MVVRMVKGGQDGEGWNNAMMSNVGISRLIFYDKVSAYGASSQPRCYKKSDGSQDARRWSPNILNEPLQQ